MKSLNLNKARKAKLLLMIKALFQEYKLKTFMDSQYGEGHETPACINLVFAKKKDDLVTTIHWYEFCIQELPFKLFGFLVRNNIYDKDEYHDWLYDDMSWLSNPIDFLYEHFLKLK